jgi:hypothetical protein
MKKTLLISALLLVFFLTSGIASARGFWGHRFFHPRAFVGPPVISAPVPAYPSPYGFYSPGYYGYRVWIPGHWADVWTGYGWQRVWNPGHWKYRR